MKGYEPKAKKNVTFLNQDYYFLILMNIYKYAPWKIASNLILVFYTFMR